MHDPILIWSQISNVMKYNLVTICSLIYFLPANKAYMLMNGTTRNVIYYFLNIFCG